MCRSWPRCSGLTHGSSSNDSHCSVHGHESKVLKEFLIKKDGQSFVTMKKRNLKLFFKNSNNTNFNTETSFSSYFRVYFNIELSSFHSQGPY